MIMLLILTDTAVSTQLQLALARRLTFPNISHSTC